jgi:hypothetical protein
MMAEEIDAKKGPFAKKMTTFPHSGQKLPTFVRHLQLNPTHFMSLLATHFNHTP